MNYLRVLMNRNIYVFEYEEALLVRNSIDNSIRNNDNWCIFNTKEYGKLYLNINLIESIEFKKI